MTYTIKDTIQHQKYMEQAKSLGYEVVEIRDGGLPWTVYKDGRYFTWTPALDECNLGSRATMNTEVCLLKYRLCIDQLDFLGYDIVETRDGELPWTVCKDGKYFIFEQEQMNLLLKKTWARLAKGKLVELTDFDGEKTITIAYPIGNQRMKAERYWPFNIMAVILNPDGSISPDIDYAFSESYVQSWKYV